MRLVHCSVLACLGIIGATIPAHAAFTEIYKVLGVKDNVDRATSIHCSNIGTTSVDVRVRVTQSNGTTAGSIVTQTLLAKETKTWSTKQTVTYVDASGDLGTGGLAIAFGTVLTNNSNVVLCTAEYLDSSASPPAFMHGLRMIRLPRSTSGGED
jgi:hypothetical protein